MTAVCANCAFLLESRVGLKPCTRLTQSQKTITLKMISAQFFHFSQFLIVLGLHRGRVHSIFVLRLFNDGVAMWLLYGAVYLFLLNR